MWLGAHQFCALGPKGLKVTDNKTPDFLVPVILSVYDRGEHFLRALKSLSLNEGANRTKLYIASDGPRDRGATKKVQEIRHLIEGISGFEAVISWEPKENTNGAIQRELLEFVMREHEAFIFAEDDNVFSHWFLQFMNDALTLYKDEAQVRAVCGYLYPKLSFEPDHQVFLQHFIPWGYGTWSNRFSEEEPANLARAVLSRPDVFRQVNSTLPHLIRLNRRVVLEGLPAADAHIANELVLNNQVCVFPPSSLVRNTGSDGSGMNRKRDVRFEHQTVMQTQVRIDPRVSKVPTAAGTLKIRRFLGGPLARFGNVFIHFEFTVKSKWAARLLSRLNTRALLVAQRVMSLSTVVRNSAAPLAPKSRKVQVAKPAR